MPATTTAAARPHLLVGNFSNQMLGLYHNEGNGLFVDEAPASTVGRASLLTLAFGVFFFDYDLDGYPDIFAANGHIEDEIGRVQPKVSYQRSRRCCSATWATGKFENVTKTHGRGLHPPHRGARRRLRRFRPRRRSRRPDHHQQRPGVSVTATTAAIAITGCAVRLSGSRSRIAMASAPWCA